MKPTRTYLALGVVSGLFFLLLSGAGLVLPAMAHQDNDDHHGCTWQVTGSHQECQMIGYGRDRHLVCHTVYDYGWVCPTPTPTPAPVVNQPDPGPQPFTDPYWGTLPSSACEALGGDNAIHLNSVDDERLYVTLTHDGIFSAEVITHDSEGENLFLHGCLAPNYFRSTCSVQRLSGSGTLSFTITGSRDFRVIAAPDYLGDPLPTSIQITDHFVDYSGTSSGRILDQSFKRNPDMSACRYFGD